MAADGTGVLRGRIPSGQGGAGQLRARWVSAVLPSSAAGVLSSLDGRALHRCAWTPEQDALELALQLLGAGCGWTAAGLLALHLHRPALPERGRPRAAHDSPGGRNILWPIQPGSADEPMDHHETYRARYPFRHRADTTRPGPRFLVGPLFRLGSSVRVPLRKHSLVPRPDGPARALRLGPQTWIVSRERACRVICRRLGRVVRLADFSAARHRPSQPDLRTRRPKHPSRPVATP